jgi:hypothetical protein
MLTETIGNRRLHCLLTCYTLSYKTDEPPLRDVSALIKSLLLASPTTSWIVIRSLTKRKQDHHLFNIIQQQPSNMPLQIDHTTLVVPTSKLDDIVNFLLAALEPLGLREWMRPIPTSVGLGDKTPFFWVTGIEGDEETLRVVMRNEHFAFSAGSMSCFPSPSC